MTERRTEEHTSLTHLHLLSSYCLHTAWEGGQINSYATSCFVFFSFLCFRKIEDFFLFSSTVILLESIFGKMSNDKESYWVGGWERVGGGGSRTVYETDKTA